MLAHRVHCVICHGRWLPFGCIEPTITRLGDADDGVIWQFHVLEHRSYPVEEAKASTFTTVAVVYADYPLRCVGIVLMTSKRLTREDWLDTGLNRLADSGPSALTLDRMCEYTQKTKGSFYHHFQDHAEFISDLAQLYRQRTTLDIIEQTQSGESEQRLYDLNQLATALNPRLEIEIRRLASAHPSVETILNQVDSDRLSYLVELYESQGISKDLAKSIARIEYAAFIGHNMIWPTASASEAEADGLLFGQMVFAFCREKQIPI